MSPEISANPPSVTKRKKNRERKAASEPMHNFDLNMPSCNYFSVGQHPYSSFSIPEMPNYYPFMNCSNTSEPMSLPIYPINYPGYTCPGSMMGSIGNISRNSTLSNHTFNITSEFPDYMSLPVANLDTNEGSKRRFSDPGLPNDSDSGGSNSCDERVVQKLTQQIHSLKVSNNRLSREVMDLRIELNLLKQQQGGKHYDREYEPGMLADIIREVREAARVREDALLARVKHIMEEKHLSMNQLNLTTEKNRNNDRIAKLEEQLKNLTVSNNSRSDESLNALNTSTQSLYDNKTQSAHILDLEKEAMELRKELEDTRAKKEEADQRLLKLSNVLLKNDILVCPELSEDVKPTPCASVPKVTTSGPVTSL